MPIQLTCSCGRKLQAEDEHAGRRVRCPACGAEMTVPRADDDAVRPAEVAEPKASPVQPAKPRRVDVPDEEDGGRPRRRSRREVEDDEDDDRPRRRSRREDDEDDGEDRPRRRRRAREDEDDYGRRREPGGTSGKAVAALVLGLLTFCLGLLAGIPAIILAVMGLKDINRSRGRLAGKGLAIAGLVLGCLSIVTTVLIALLAPAVFMVREAAERMKVQNDLRVLALAMHNESDVQGHLPEAYPDPKRGGPVRTKLSWRVQLLPYLEQDNLYKQFRHDEPWDGPNNKKLVTRMPKVFAHPKHPETEAQGLTYYRVFTGPLTAFPPLGPARIPAGFPDGTSNTILIVEAADPVPWTKPDELEYDPNKPLPRIGGHFRGGTVAVMADGMPHVIGPGVSQQTLRAAITASGGDVLGADW